MLGTLILARAVDDPVRRDSSSKASGSGLTRAYRVMCLTTQLSS
jgi:hypothetical protein